MCPFLSFWSDLYQRKDSYSVLFHYRVQSLPYFPSVEAGEGKLKSDTHLGGGGGGVNCTVIYIRFSGDIVITLDTLNK